ncbi:sulfurtransferase complex subunit TusC [Ferrimonas marina]|uniref:tRNA 2-thiouridine synthesizing protein C n=1 Tax=Ferrimonas marina TaxID=299255 RepID=A0A1M5NM83_9GAMM|nr:sulfurtransferase complex subunit TusC [Ferrimonas marina]SHG90651.1 tRNA 2-thiouridine synthesizing protein C [Ferrimonas marina]
MSTTIVFRTVPHGDARGREGLDLLLLAASYEVPLTALFIGDGVYQLLANQQPELIDSKDHISTFKALPLYDVEEIWVCADSLAERDLTSEQLILPVQTASPDAIRQQLANSQQVLTF